MTCAQEINVSAPDSSPKILSFTGHICTKGLAGSVMEFVERQLREQAKACRMKAGTTGFTEGHLPHLPDCAELGLAARERIIADTIAQCWLKVNMLPVVIQAELQNAAGPSVLQQYQHLPANAKNHPQEAATRSLFVVETSLVNPAERPPIGH
ncbi:unnamed protein product [Discosporangium mesarthrocarpum]